MDKVEFFVVYIKEAHPTDGWFMGRNEKAGVNFAAPKTLDERVAIAGEACSVLKLQMPCLVDDIEDSTDTKYEAAPDRLYAIDLEGNIAVQGEPGPFGFAASVDKVKNWLAANLPSA